MGTSASSLLLRENFDPKIRQWSKFVSSNSLRTSSLKENLGHSGTVNTLDIYACFILSGSDDATVRLWVISNKSCLNILLGHTGPVTSVRFHPAGVLCVSCSIDKTIRLWNPHKNVQMGVWTGHSMGVFDCSFSRGGQLLASGGTDGTLIIWDALSLSTTTPLQHLRGHTASVNCISFSKEDHSWELLLSGSSDKSLRLWNCTSGYCLRVFIGHESSVTTCEISSDSFIISSDSSGMVKAWDLSEGLCLQSFDDFVEPNSTMNNDCIRGIWFYDDSVYLYTKNNTIYKWTITAKSPAIKLISSADNIQSCTTVRFIDSMGSMVIGYEDGSIKIWQIFDPQHISKLSKVDQNDANLNQMINTTYTLEEDLKSIHNDLSIYDAYDDNNLLSSNGTELYMTSLQRRNGITTHDIATASKNIQSSTHKKCKKNYKVLSECVAKMMMRRKSRHHKNEESTPNDTSNTTLDSITKKTNRGTVSGVSVQLVTEFSSVQDAHLEAARAAEASLIFLSRPRGNKGVPHIKAWTSSSYRDDGIGKLETANPKASIVAFTKAMNATVETSNKSNKNKSMLESKQNSLKHQKRKYIWRGLAGLKSSRLRLGMAKLSDLPVEDADRMKINSFIDTAFKDSTFMKKDEFQEKCWKEWVVVETSISRTVGYFTPTRNDTEKNNKSSYASENSEPSVNIKLEIDKEFNRNSRIWWSRPYRYGFTSWLKEFYANQRTNFPIGNPRVINILHAYSGREGRLLAVLHRKYDLIDVAHPESAAVVRRTKMFENGSNYLGCEESKTIPDKETKSNSSIDEKCCNVEKETKEASPIKNAWPKDILLCPTVASHNIPVPDLYIIIGSYIWFPPPINETFSESLKSLINGCPAGEMTPKYSKVLKKVENSAAKVGYTLDHKKMLGFSDSEYWYCIPFVAKASRDVKSLPTNPNTSNEIKNFQVIGAESNKHETGLKRLLIPFEKDMENLYKIPVQYTVLDLGSPKSKVMVFVSTTEKSHATLEQNNQRKFLENVVKDMKTESLVVDSSTVICIQRYIRGYRCRMTRKRILSAVKCIQRHFRGHRCKIKHKRVLSAIMCIQRHVRGHQSRWNVSRLKAALIEEQIDFGRAIVFRRSRLNYSNASQEQCSAVYAPAGTVGLVLPSVAINAAKQNKNQSWGIHAYGQTSYRWFANNLRPICFRTFYNEDLTHSERLTSTRSLRVRTAVVHGNSSSIRSTITSTSTARAAAPTVAEASAAATLAAALGSEPTVDEIRILGEVASMQLVNGLVARGRTLFPVSVSFPRDTGHLGGLHQQLPQLISRVNTVGIGGRRDIIVEESTRVTTEDAIERTDSSDYEYYSDYTDDETNTQEELLHSHNFYGSPNYKTTANSIMTATALSAIDYGCSVPTAYVGRRPYPNKVHTRENSQSLQDGDRNAKHRSQIGSTANRQRKIENFYRNIFDINSPKPNKTTIINEKFVLGSKLINTGKANKEKENSNMKCTIPAKDQHTNNSCNIDIQNKSGKTCSGNISESLECIREWHNSSLNVTQHDILMQKCHDAKSRVRIRNKSPEETVGDIICESKIKSAETEVVAKDEITDFIKDQKIIVSKRANLITMFLGRHGARVYSRQFGIDEVNVVKSVLKENAKRAEKKKKQMESKSKDIAKYNIILKPQELKNIKTSNNKVGITKVKSLKRRKRVEGK